MSIEDPHAARFQRARMLLGQGQRDQALAELYSLVTVAPEHVEAWWLIAQITPHTLQRKEALQHVLRLDPDHPEARQVAARLAQFEAPTRQGAPPPGVDTPPPPPPAQPHYAPPVSAPPEPPREAPREREVVYVERTRGELQPFLVLNGGCTSGCFALFLTILAMTVLAFLLVGGTVTQALRSTGALAPDQSVTIGLAPAIAVTAVLAFLRANPAALPIALGGLLGPLLGVPGGSVPDNAALFTQVLQGMWSSLGFPTSTGEAILNRLGALGPQLNNISWLALAIFLFGWVLLAFFFVFLRARSNRLLHWGLSTVGLWLLTGLACGLGILLYRAVTGGM